MKKSLSVVSTLAAALLILTSTAGCWVNLFAPRDRATPSRTPTQGRPATATLWPTATPKQTRPSPAPTSTPVPPTATTRPTLAPTATAVVAPTSVPQALPTQAPPAPTAVPPTVPEVAPGIPGTPNTPFDVTFSERQLNDYIAGQLISEGGVEVSDPQVTLGEGEALVHAFAYHEASDLRMGLTLRGTPVVHEGALYVRVNEVTLDDDIRGFTRLLAKTLIDAAIASYSGEHGIAVPIDTITFESIIITPGNVRIVGRTR